MPERISEVFRRRLHRILRLSVPIVLITFFAGFGLGAAIWKPETKPLPRPQAFRVMDLLTTAYSNLAEERGLAFKTMKQGVSLDASGKTLLHARRRRSNFLLDQFEDQVNSGALGLLPTNIFFRSLVYNRRDVSQRRQEVDDWKPDEFRTEFDQKPRHWFNSVSRLLVSLANMHSALHARLRIEGFEPEASSAMQLQYLALLMNDYAGRERAIISGIIGENEPYTEVERRELILYRTRIESVWESIRILAKGDRLEPRIKELIAKLENSFFANVDGIRKHLEQANLAGKPYPVSSEEWFSKYTKAMKGIVSISREAGKLSHKIAKLDRDD